MSIEIVKGLPKVGKVGFGAMSLTTFGVLPQTQVNEILLAALQLNNNFWNAGTFYGPADDRHANLRVLNQFFVDHPEAKDKVFLSVKGGINLERFAPDGSTDNITKSIDLAVSSLAPSGKKVDQYCLSRVDASVGIEESVHAIAAGIKAGKIGSYCLSEVSTASIKKAHAIHPVSAVEIEVSLLSLEAYHNGVLSTCAELGIPVIAYSPMGRGLLTGAIKSADDAKGLLKTFDRFKDEHIQKNQAAIDKVGEIAARHKATQAQVALEWVLKQSKRTPQLPVVLPIPGTSNIERLRDNQKPAHLTDAEVDELFKFFDSFNISGTRYFPQVEQSLYV